MRSDRADQIVPPTQAHARPVSFHRHRPRLCPGNCAVTPVAVPSPPLSTNPPVPHSDRPCESAPNLAQATHSPAAHPPTGLLRTLRAPNPIYFAQQTKIHSTPSPAHFAARVAAISESPPSPHRSVRN